MTEPTIAPGPNEAPDLLPLEKILGMAQPIPAEPGVYFLIEDGRVVYVGQSVLPMSRVGAHLANPSKYFTHVAWIPVEKKDLIKVENAYIAHFLPMYNRTVNGGPIQRYKSAKDKKPKELSRAEKIALYGCVFKASRNKVVTDGPR